MKSRSRVNSTVMRQISQVEVFPMKKLAKLILIVEILTVGCIGAARWLRLRQAAQAQPKLVLGPRCQEGLVSVETQPDAPVRLTVVDAGCDQPQTASVGFVAENVSSLAITKYEVRAIETYDELVDKGSSVTEMVRVFNPHETRTGFIGGGVGMITRGKPAGPLRHYQIALASVTFVDGTTWNWDQLPHNNSLHASRTSGPVIENLRVSQLRAAASTQPFARISYLTKYSCDSRFHSCSRYS